MFKSELFLFDYEYFSSEFLKRFRQVERTLIEMEWSKRRRGSLLQIIHEIKKMIHLKISDNLSTDRYSSE